MEPVHRCNNDLRATILLVAKILKLDTPVTTCCHKKFGRHASWYIWVDFRCYTRRSSAKKPPGQDHSSEHTHMAYDMHSAEALASKTRYTLQDAFTKALRSLE